MRITNNPLSPHYTESSQHQRGYGQVIHANGSPSTHILDHDHDHDVDDEQRRARAKLATRIMETA
ncbi:MAG TPA: hypothetical protein VJV39_15035 [Dongiaceae bacterium]|nr:hypothetical protein [Dongiaceae bacterium]